MSATISNVIRMIVGLIVVVSCVSCSLEPTRQLTSLKINCLKKVVVANLTVSWHAGSVHYLLTLSPESPEAAAEKGAIHQMLCPELFAFGRVLLYDSNGKKLDAIALSSCEESTEGGNEIYQVTSVRNKDFVTRIDHWDLK